nr:hypothetical protein [Tanacetum cinerariifolium]
MYYPWFMKVIIHHFLSKDPSIPRRNKFDALLPIELINKEIRNSNAYKEYYAAATGAAPPKPKASTYISQASGSGADKGAGCIPGVPDVSTDKSEEELSYISTKDEGDDEGKDGDGDDDNNGDDEVVRDDEKEGKDDEQEYNEDEYDEEIRDEESFDPILKTPKNSYDEGNGEEDFGLNVGREEGHDEEEEEDKLYKDVNINQGRGIQATLEVEDSHVTLTTVNPDFQQQSSSVSSQFVTSMLNPTLDIGMESIFKTTSQMDAQTPTSVSDHLCNEAQKENDEFLKTVDENMQNIIKEQTSYAVVADLSEMELKKILIEKMEGNKSIQRSDEQRNLYKALIEAYESDKIILDTYGETVTLKRRRDDDADKDEEPSARLDRGSKRRREGKEPESASAPTEITTFQMEEPSHPEFDIGAEDQPIVQSSQHPEWFSQQQKPPTSDRDWNKTLPATHGSFQPWISELAKQSDSHSSFNELMDIPLDFSNFLINRLKVDTLTLELLGGPTYELMNGSCKSLIELEYNLEEVFKATTDQLDWVNPKGKPTYLTVEERFAFNVSLRMFTRSIVIQRRMEDLQLGFIYQNKDKKNRLMRIDELHKFSDRTLIDVRTALDDRLNGIWMQYLPQSIWRKSDKERAAAMIQAIDKRLKKRGS